KMVLGQNAERDMAAVRSFEGAVTGHALHGNVDAVRLGASRPGPRDKDVGHGDVDSFSFAGFEATYDGGADPEGGRHPASQIGDRDSRNYRWATLGRQRPGPRLVVQVMTGGEGKRPILAHARNRAVDHGRIDRSDVVVADTEAPGNARPK